MHRQVWAFAGHTYHIVGNLMSWLIISCFSIVWILYVTVNNFSVMSGHQYQAEDIMSCSRYQAEDIMSCSRTLCSASVEARTGIMHLDLESNLYHYNNCAPFFFADCIITCRVRQDDPNITRDNLESWNHWHTILENCIPYDIVTLVTEI